MTVPVLIRRAAELDVVGVEDWYEDQRSRRVTVVLGYTFLYASDVVRPGHQVDRTINPTQNASFGGAPPTPLVGAARPAFHFHSSDFWAQGLNVGVVLRF